MIDPPGDHRKSSKGDRSVLELQNSLCAEIEKDYLDAVFCETAECTFPKVSKEKCEIIFLFCCFLGPGGTLFCGSGSVQVLKSSEEF